MDASSGPVPFIQHDGQSFHVCEEGARLLAGIDGPVVVIAVAGIYRTGKSFLLNQLVGHAGFTVGDSIASCTRGTSLWVPRQLRPVCEAIRQLLPPPPALPPPPPLLSSSSSSSSP